MGKEMGTPVSQPNRSVEGWASPSWPPLPDVLPEASLSSGRRFESCGNGNDGRRPNDEENNESGGCLMVKTQATGWGFQQFPPVSSRDGERLRTPWGRRMCSTATLPVVCVPQAEGWDLVFINSQDSLMWLMMKQIPGNPLWTSGKTAKANPFGIVFLLRGKSASSTDCAQNIRGR